MVIWEFHSEWLGARNCSFSYTFLVRLIRLTPLAMRIRYLQVVRSDTIADNNRNLSIFHHLNLYITGHSHIFKIFFLTIFVLVLFVFNATYQRVEPIAKYASTPVLNGDEQAKAAFCTINGTINARKSVYRWGDAASYDILSDSIFWLIHSRRLSYFATANCSFKSNYR